MTERPILFSGPMIRALLAGTKTQTRRLVRNTTGGCAACFNDPRLAVPHHGEEAIFGGGPYLRLAYCEHNDRGGDRIRCPYGVPGDRLWVRETWATPQQDIVAYQADGKAGAWMGNGEGGRMFIHHGWIDGAASSERTGRWFGLTKYSDRRRKDGSGAWRSGRFMPRWASRLTLEVTSVRVERLQDITEADILAEGVTVDMAAEMTGVPWSSLPTLHHAWAAGWDSINGKRAPWDSNPWVWVLGFRRASADRKGER